MGKKRVACGAFVSLGVPLSLSVSSEPVLRKIVSRPKKLVGSHAQLRLPRSECLVFPETFAQTPLLGQSDRGLDPRGGDLRSGS